DASLIAAGPDDVVYFALAGPAPEYADVLAVSVAPADAGTLLERFPEILPFGDADLFVAPDGLVTRGWYEEGFRPAADDVPFLEWLRRDGGSVPFATRSFQPAGFD